MSIIRVPRRPGLPGWAIALVGAWAAVLGTAVALSQSLDRPLNLCLFKSLTSLPCPTCGSTRSCLALLDADVASAIAFNPLTFLSLVALAGAAFFRIGLGRRVVLNLSQRARRALLAGGVLAVVLNWIYLIARGI